MTDVSWPGHITADDAPALDDLAAAGVGEGDFGEDHNVPPDLITLSEVLQWNAAVQAAIVAGDVVPRCPACGTERTDYEVTDAGPQHLDACPHCGSDERPQT